MGNEIKNEFASLCWGLKKTQDKWEFFWDILKDYPEYHDLFKTKMTNLLVLLESDEDRILSMDIQNEIWDLI